MEYASGGKSQQHERRDLRENARQSPASATRKAQRAVLVIGVSLLLVSGVLGRLATAAGATAGVALDGLAEVMAAVLGLSLTVVAIVVQLAGQRYSAKVVDLFMRDPVNGLVFGFMVISCVYTAVLPALVLERAAAGTAAALAYGLAVVNFGLLLPYVRYVFAFLQPDSIIRTIERSASRSLSRAAAGDLSRGDLGRARRSVAEAIERIADNCLAAVGHQDRNLALHTIQTIERLVCHYYERKRGLPVEWAKVEAGAFASLAEAFFEEIVAEGSWVEAKAMLEFEHIMRRALGGMDELVSQLASSTRVVGATALTAGDIDVVRMAVRFFNTFIRHGLNAGNIRAIYNILEHLRRLASELLHRRPEMAIEILEHLLYYAHRASEAGFPFVTETIAHDIRVLCQEAHLTREIDVVPFVERLLELDRRPESADRDVALVGVRKAQAILGAFFVVHDAPELVDMIRADMRCEPSEHLSRIRDAILGVKERRFWEITDRGFNFDYVEEAHRGAVCAFFVPLLLKGAATSSEVRPLRWPSQNETASGKIGAGPCEEASSRKNGLSPSSRKQRQA